MSEPSLRVLSLGAGVQSSTLYLMAVEGEFGDERPDAAVFADTQWEPRAVYDWLDALDAYGEGRIPIHRVTQGSIREGALSTRINPTSGRESRIVSLPVFVQNADGSGGMLHRQCTRDFKIRPIRRRVRELLTERGVPASRASVEQWMGISTDEASRMRDSGVRYVVNRYPLVERNMSRRDCERWLSDHGYPTPPKSACIGCPYTDDDRWRAIRERPEEWADAVAFDHSIRQLAQVNGQTYLHRSLRPLDEVDFTQADSDQVDMFENECEGMCGV